MDLVTVCVCTYGDDSWQTLAQQALASAAEQAPALHVHGRSLHAARNAALDLVDTPAIVYLDADDELEPGYIAALAGGQADLRAPAVRYHRGTRTQRPAYVPRVAGHDHACAAECIISGDGNWLVIGTWAPVDLLRRAGGWRDWPVYEDFDLWMRCLLLGATVEAIPAAVYRALVRPDSRNRAPSMRVKNDVHHAIVAANMPAVAA